jgi:hypothetical protein
MQPRIDYAGVLGGWYSLCLNHAGPKMSTRLVYNLPTVMWRMQRAHSFCHAVIAPRRDGALFVWFLNNRPLGHRDFADWTDALRWSEQLQAQNWAAGWRLVDELEPLVDN